MRRSNVTPVGEGQRGGGVDDFGVQPVPAVATGLAGQLQDLNRVGEPDPPPIAVAFYVRAALRR